MSLTFLVYRLQKMAAIHNNWLHYYHREFINQVTIDRCVVQSGISCLITQTPTQPFSGNRNIHKIKYKQKTEWRTVIMESTNNFSCFRTLQVFLVRNPWRHSKSDKSNLFHVFIFLSVKRAFIVLMRQRTFIFCSQFKVTQCIKLKLRFTIFLRLFQT